MQRTYGDDVQFLLVYIKEAHAIDSPSPMSRVLIEDPVTFEERQGVAQTCIATLEMENIQAVVDRMDDAVNKAYQGWPDRLYLVGKDGKLAYAGGRGPFGFKTDDLEDAIQAELKANGSEK